MTREGDRDVRLDRLEVFLGDWRLEVPAFLPPELADAARATFEWTLDGAFLLQQSFVPVPEAPNGLCVIGPTPTTAMRSTTSTPAGSHGSTG
jgi:hypothetical protein